jgi:hypothetical protein
LRPKQRRSGYLRSEPIHRATNRYFVLLAVAPVAARRHTEHVRPVMIARDHEIDQLGAALAEARVGNGRVMLLVGDAGTAMAFGGLLGSTSYA